MIAIQTRFRESILLSAVIACFAFVVAQVAGADSSPSSSSWHRDICIDTPYAFDSLGKSVGAAFMAISARSGFSDVLVSARSPQAGNVMLHDTVVEGGVVMMRHVDGFSFDSDAPLILKPRGPHIMLMGLDQPLTERAMLQIELEFRKTGKIVVDVPVRAVSNSSTAHKLGCK